MAQDLTKMQDIKYSEKSLWQQYSTYVQNQDIVSAVNLLNANPNLKYKVFNAFNWNRLINAVNDGTSTSQPTTDSMLGQWNYDYGRLQTASANFKYVGQWASGTQYYTNNLVKFNDTTAYFCIQNHTASTENQPPNSTYWIMAVEALPSLGIQVSHTTPTQIRVGDIWFDVYGDYLHSVHLILSNIAILVDANFEMFLDLDSELTVQDCLNQIEIIGGNEGIDATGTCVDGYGHSGPISKLQYVSSTNTLSVTFTDATIGAGTLHWPLSSEQYRPDTETINDVVTEITN